MSGGNLEGSIEGEGSKSKDQQLGRPIAGGDLHRNRLVGGLWMVGHIMHESSSLLTLSPHLLCVDWRRSG